MKGVECSGKVWKCLIDSYASWLSNFDLSQPEAWPLVRIGIVLKWSDPADSQNHGEAFGRVGMSEVEQKQNSSSTPEINRHDDRAVDKFDFTASNCTRFVNWDLDRCLRLICEAAIVHTPGLRSVFHSAFVLQDPKHFDNLLQLPRTTTFPR
jgi:hypothetical protein